MKRLFVISFVIVAAQAGTLTTSSPPSKCDRAPAQAQSTDLYYKLRIVGDPDLYLPGELYTIKLEGVDKGQGPAPFSGFTIWIEFDEEAVDDLIREGGQTVPGNQTLGTFHASNSQIKVREFCKPAVVNASIHPKTQVLVTWNAPFSTSEVCVRICARAGPVMTRHDIPKTWSVLARKICSTPIAPPNFTRQPPIVDPCCACDEAKYEVTFEGSWSRNTHPRDFPPVSAHAHFGDLIGASHNAHYRVWQEGRVASGGLRRLVDDGVTTALEKELKAESEHIRTIIKARGIAWQPVSTASTSSTFAVFRVDAKHHLVSLAAKLAPSPDWFVGVSALELCNANCTWSKSATLQLYPYDAGTDNGLGYTSRRQPTIPAAPVRALRPDWPRDVRSPFFSTNGEMRSFARLRLTRLRLYEKICDDSGAEQAKEREGGACATHPWSAWGPCSVTCGQGRAMRQRYFVWPLRAQAETCRVTLTDYRHCYGPRRHCRAISEYEADPAEKTGPCAVSAWSAWSACEGCGVRARTRHYVVPRATKRCHTGFRSRTVMSQAMPCEAGPCHRPPGISANSTNYDWFYLDTPLKGECAVTAWGEWSPCSARCGRGRRLRSRMYVTRDSRVQHQLSRRLLAEWNKRFAELQNIEIPSENITSDDPEIQALVEEHIESCQFTLTQQEALCDGESKHCFNTSYSKEICSLPSSVGHCRGYTERWFYHVEGKTCEPFGYTGCGGNLNNFPQRDECMRVCGSLANDTDPSTTTQPFTAKPSSTISSTAKPSTTISSSAKYSTVQSSTAKPSTVKQANLKLLTVDKVVKKQVNKPTVVTRSEDNEVMQNDSPHTHDVNCETGPWLGWSHCLGECDFTFKLNYRLVTRNPSGSGKGCPGLIKVNACRPSQCRHVSYSNVTLITTHSP